MQATKLFDQSRNRFDKAKNNYLENVINHKKERRATQTHDSRRVRFVG